MNFLTSDDLLIFFFAVVVWLNKCIQGCLNEIFDQDGESFPFSEGPPRRGVGGLNGGVDGGRGVGGWAGANVMEGNAAVNCAEQ